MKKLKQEMIQKIKLRINNLLSDNNIETNLVPSEDVDFNSEKICDEILSLIEAEKKKTWQEALLSKEEN